MITRHPLVAGTLAILSLLLMGVCTCSQAAPLDEWLWSNPLPQGNSLYAACHGNGQFLAVGEFGTILISPDGTNWSRSESGTFETLNGCTYAAGQFVAVGNFGTILTSRDGQTWSHQFAATFYDLKSITFGKGQFVAVGRLGSILTSPDAVTWSQRANGPITLTSVAFGNEAFVAVGGDVILTSTNGSTWVRRPMPVMGSLLAIHYDDGKFVAVGGTLSYAYYDYLNVVAVSEDGMNWTGTSFPAALAVRGVAFGNGRWAAVASVAYSEPYGGYEAAGMVFTSTDLDQWTVAVSNAPPLLAVVFGANQFVGVSFDGSIFTSATGFEWQSPDSGLSGVPYGFVDLQYLNGSFVGLTQDRVSFSPDGVTWTTPHVFTTNRYYGEGLHSVAYGKGLYVAGGEYQRMWISTNGRNWTQVAPELDVANFVADVSQVIFENDMFMAVPGFKGNVLFSTNGVDWWVKSVSTNYNDYFQSAAIAYGAGTCVVLGGSEIAASSDLTNWVRSIPYKSIYFQAVTFGNGRFVAVGQSGIACSVDGTNWVGRTSTEFGALSDVVFGGGYFIAVGGDTESLLASQRKVWVSTNGLDWSARALNTRRSLSQVAYGSGTFVAAGDRAVILRCPVTVPQPVVALSMAPGNRTITVMGMTGCSYRIECLNDFTPGATWTPLRTVIASDGVATFTDTSFAEAQRFYRAVLLPAP